MCISDVRTLTLLGGVVMLISIIGIPINKTTSFGGGRGNSRDRSDDENGGSSDNGFVKSPAIA